MPTLRKIKRAASLHNIQRICSITCPDFSGFNFTNRTQSPPITQPMEGWQFEGNFGAKTALKNYFHRQKIKNSFPNQKAVPHERFVTNL